MWSKLKIQYGWTVPLCIHSKPLLGPNAEIRGQFLHRVGLKQDGDEQLVLAHHFYRLGLVS